MAKTYYPFDAGDGGVVTEAEWATMARLWQTTGVIAGEDAELEVSADGTDMTVDVDTGVAWVRGFYFASDAVETLTLSDADPFEARLDRIVVRLDRAANTIDLAILEGTPDPAPVAPSLTQDDVTWEVPLATVEVPASASSISAGNVTDDRELVATPAFRAGGVNPAEAEGVAWVRQADGAYVPVDVMTADEYAGAHTKGAHDSLGIDADTVDGKHAAAFVEQALVDAAGDLIVGTADNTVGRLAKGADETFLGVQGGILGFYASGGGGVDVQTFTASGTWNKPDGAVMVIVEAIAGGGGGGDDAPAWSGDHGSGGGGGGGLRALFAADDLASSVSVTVGSAGAGGVDADGGAGGDSVFGSLQVAGGKGGTRPAGGAGGDGGDAGAGDGGTAGGAGGSGVTAGGGGSGRDGGANGGDAIIGGGGGGGGGAGVGGTSRVSGDGGDGEQPGSAPGGGGGGGVEGSLPGQDGGRGEVRVYTYF